MSTTEEKLPEIPDDYVVPDDVGVIHGWRAFMVLTEYSEDKPTQYRRLMASPAYFTVWPPKQRLEAICQHHKHECPDANCNCGIHIARSPKTAFEYVSSAVTMHAFARVAGWGRIFEGTIASRVQKAYPQYIYLVNGHEAAAKELEQTYGVPVTSVPNVAYLETMLFQHEYRERLLRIAEKPLRWMILGLLLGVALAVSSSALIITRHALYNIPTLCIDLVCVVVFWILLSQRLQGRKLLQDQVDPLSM